MRPMSTDAMGQQRPGLKKADASSSSDEHHQHHAPSPMTYFLADEATVAAATASAASSAQTGGSGSAPGSHSPVGAKDYGVRSLEASVEDSDLLRSSWAAPKSSKLATGRGGGRESSVVVDEDGEEHEEHEEHEEDVVEDEEDQDDLRSLDSMQSSLPPGNIAASPQTLLSGPLTPLMGPTSDAPGTPRSNWDISEKSDTSRKAEKRPESPSRPRSEAPAMSPSNSMSMSMPQLIMPEITMPSRRPFTAKGKQIGRLKVLIAGDSGIGKTSLIKSIVQTCEDIVHVDPVSLPQYGVGYSPKHGPSTYSHSKKMDDSTKHISEVYASTKPYPHWWSDIDDSKVLRRRRLRATTEEQVIERNLCFVDTPGYGSGTSFLECIEPVVKYVESQFERTNATVNNGEGDLMSIISGNGTSQVDVVFYVVLHRLKPVDVEFMRRLSPYTSVLPVIAKADTLTPQQVTQLKLSILTDLRNAGIRPFLFGNSSSEILRRAASPKDEPLPTPFAPFAVSSIVASDSENMDASVLMSPEYVPPLVDTELADLVNAVFDPENIAWLRHAAAKKYMQWKSKTALSSSTQALATTTRPGTPIQRRGSPMLGSGTLIRTSADSFALARVSDHTQREEALAKVRLSRWAHDLQRSLQAERERYEQLARGERAVWLTERLGEVVADGQLVPVASLPKHVKDAMAKDAGFEGGKVDGRDPLGLLGLSEGVLGRAVLMVKIAGLGGVIGLVGVWVVNRWGVPGAWQAWLPAMQGE